MGHVACMGWRGEVRTGFWRGNLRESDHFEDPGVDNIEMDLQMWNVGAWTGSVWLRLGKGGGYL